MKRCLILTGGKLSLAFAGSFLKEHKFEKVVAVDGGLEAAKELDIIPDVIVGDFDTVRSEILSWPITGKWNTSYGKYISRKRMIQTQNLPLSGLLP